MDQEVEVRRGQGGTDEEDVWDDDTTNMEGKSHATSGIQHKTAHGQTWLQIALMRASSMKRRLHTKDYDNDDTIATSSQ